MKCQNALEYLDAQIQNVRRSLEEVHFSQLTACILTRVWSSNFLSIIIKSPCIYSTVFGLSHNSYSCLNIAVKSWHLPFGIYFSAGPKTDMDHQTIMLYYMYMTIMEIQTLGNSRTNSIPLYLSCSILAYMLVVFIMYYWLTPIMHNND